ncbi:hypothetical protein K8Q98_03055 [Candidatus Nomurabacteria bacterium]|nr:hypothetical protein [Candidatus Nomurabacteria bacterium]
MATNVRDEKAYDETLELLCRTLYSMDPRQFSVAPAGFMGMFRNIFFVMGATPDATLNFQFELGGVAFSVTKAKGEQLVATATMLVDGKPVVPLNVIVVPSTPKTGGTEEAY